MPTHMLREGNRPYHIHTQFDRALPVAAIRVTQTTGGILEFYYYYFLLFLLFFIIIRLYENNKLPN